MNAPDRAKLRESHVGSSALRREDLRFLTGTGRYTDDVRFERMVHAALLRSTHANARVARIDTARARALEGVVLVATAADLGAEVPLIPLRLAPLPGLQRFLQPVLAGERVRYVGEPLVLVVAQSRYIAEDALDLIEVDYEALDPVTTAAQALSDAARVHEAVGTNIGSHYEVSRGDPQRAFAGAPYVRKETFRTHRHAAVALETRGLTAAWDGTKLVVRGATKVPFFNRRVLAKMLGMAESSIELSETDIGGGFGMRGEFYPEDFLIPWAARKLARPVKWIEDRREHLMAANHGRECECEIEIAMTREGVMLGMRAKVMTDIGAYVRTGGGVAAARTPQTLPGPYRIADYGCEVFVLMSNKTPAGTLRGPGFYEASFFRERLIDLACGDLGLDRVEVRRKNLIREGDMPYSIGKLVPGEAEAVIDGGDYLSALNKALEVADYAALPKNGSAMDGWMHGVGIGCYVEATGVGPAENARIVARPDGRFDVFLGIATMGQGHETIYAQVAAEVMQSPLDAFTVHHGSTAHLEESWGTYASRATVAAGSAVHLAATQMRSHLISLAASRAGIAAERLEVRDGAVVSMDDGAAVMDIGRLAAETSAEAIAATRVQARFDVKAPTYAYGTHIAHVAVDPETAVVKVMRYVAVADIGRIVNPALATGQIVGAAVQGIGATFLDELIYDDAGQLLTGSLADYLVSTSTEAPAISAVLLEESPSKSNPLGVKGAGEGGIILTGGVIANAVADALRPLGVAINALPLSLNKLSASIRVARRAARG